VVAQDGEQAVEVIRIDPLAGEGLFVEVVIAGFLDLQRLAVAIQGLHPHMHRPGDLAAQVGHAQAALIDQRLLPAEDLEARVRLLRDGTLEKDMLDEQSRRALNLSAPDEMTIMRSFSNSN
jgi:cell division protein FtsB